ncbi:YmfQ family protein [Ferrovibrio xuzhouensis]|uniref:YmfQ family protein n=1 Tax=Ferrovibrio xuzhouensis TaxID=1576914 RepID=A0ABV7VB50_9PROT
MPAMLTRLSTADYRSLLLSLLPLGPLWPRDLGSRLAAFLEGIAGEFARIHGRVMDLVEEGDPRTAYEMLARWERVCGLPDECTVPGGETIAERQLRVTQKWTSRGGQSRAYFIGIADQLGYPGAVITEFRPFTCNSNCDDSLDPDPWRFVWRMDIAQATRIVDMTCESACDEAIRVWGDTTLECVIDKLKPAHTKVLFSYGVAA